MHVSKVATLADASLSHSQHRLVAQGRPLRRVPRPGRRLLAHPRVRRLLVLHARGRGRRRHRRRAGARGATTWPRWCRSSPRPAAGSPPWTARPGRGAATPSPPTASCTTRCWPGSARDRSTPGPRGRLTPQAPGRFCAPQGRWAIMGPWTRPRPHGSTHWSSIVSDTSLPQRRELRTPLPGPKSQALAARRSAVVSAGVSSTLPVYAARAGGGVIEDVDGNLLIDLGSGIAVTTVGNAAPRVVEARRRPGRRLHPHLLHDHAVRGVRRRLRGARRAHPGRPRQEDRAVQLRRRGGRERHQGRPLRHRPDGGRRRRPRLPRPHQPHHGPDRQGDAVQEGLRPVRLRHLPRAHVLPLPRPRGHDRRAGRRPGHRDGGEAGRRRPDRRAHHRADPGRGRVRRTGPGLPARAAEVVQRQRHRPDRRRGADRVHPHRRLVRLRARGRRPRPGHRRQGHRRRPAALRRSPAGPS